MAVAFEHRFIFSGIGINRAVVIVDSGTGDFSLVNLVRKMASGDTFFGFYSLPPEVTLRVLIHCP